MFRQRLLFLVCFVGFGVALPACGSDSSGQPTKNQCTSNFDCDFGQICNDNHVCVDDTRTGVDTGSGFRDTGTTQQDTGTISQDTGTTQQDTGTVSQDTGTTQQDTGTVSQDTGTTQQDTGVADTGVADTGTADTGMADSGTTDTGMADSGTTDSGTTDAGLTDTGLTDTGVTADTGMADSGTTDTGTPAPSFSGCTSDADCDGYQRCDTTLGRCRDTRPTCNVDSDCGTGKICFSGRCTLDCTSNSVACPTGLSCTQITNAGDYACLAVCDGFQASSNQCGPDTQCVPYYGADLGLCRGVGSNAVGDTCQDDFSADGCQTGSICLQRRGAKTCQSLCAASGTPGCGTGEFCDEVFTNSTDATKNAGACFTNCGGYGSTDDTLCASDEGCQPVSSTQGYCVPNGTAQEGDTCTFDGTTNCQADLVCLPTGTDATSNNPTQGVCASYCDPTASTCSSGKSCFQVGNDANFGYCETSCDPAQDAASNTCTSGRPRCLPNTDPASPPAAGACAAAGAIADGGSCQLSNPLACSADDLCVVANDANNPLGGGSTGSGSCTRYCMAFDYASTTSRCGSGAVCAPRYFTLGLGFCTTNTTATPGSAGDTCTFSDEGKWCDDNTLCYDWFGGFNPTCQIPCDTSLPGTCPSGQSCSSISSTSTLGICQ